MQDHADIDPDTVDHIAHAAEVWTSLVAGHDVATRASHPTGPHEAPEHHPDVAVLACSDARVSPTILFSQLAGAVFEVRNAGNTVTDAALASLSFAHLALGVDLVVVLGHSHCGAVTAAVAGDHTPALAASIDPVRRALSDERCDSDDIHVASAANVHANLLRLCNAPGPLGDAIRARQVTVRGAVHDLVTGELIDVPLDVTPDVAPDVTEPADLTR